MAKWHSFLVDKRLFSDAHLLRDTPCPVCYSRAGISRIAWDPPRWTCLSCLSLLRGFPPFHEESVYRVGSRASFGQRQRFQHLYESIWRGFEHAFEPSDRRPSSHPDALPRFKRQPPTYKRYTAFVRKFWSPLFKRHQAHTPEARAAVSARYRRSYESARRWWIQRNGGTSRSVTFFFCGAQIVTFLMFSSMCKSSLLFEM
jgi:hypothetical protein